jgi:hypothetical protein
LFRIKSKIKEFSIGRNSRKSDNSLIFSFFKAGTNFMKKFIVPLNTLIIVFDFMQDKNCKSRLNPSQIFPLSTLVSIPKKSFIDLNNSF